MKQINLHPHTTARPSFLAILRKNAIRLGIAGAIALLITPVLASLSAAPAGTNQSKNNQKSLQVTTPKPQSQTAASAASAVPEAVTGGNTSTGGTDMNTSKTNVTINGQDIAVPENGVVQKTYQTDGNGQASVYVSHSSSSSGSSSSSNVEVNVQSSSSSQNGGTP